MVPDQEKVVVEPAESMMGGTWSEEDRQEWRRRLGQEVRRESREHESTREHERARESTRGHERARKGDTSLLVSATGNFPRRVGSPNETRRAIPIRLLGAALAGRKSWKRCDRANEP